MEQGIAMLGLILSILMDGMLVAECTRPDLVNFGKIVRPFSIFFIILITFRVTLWII